VRPPGERRGSWQRATSARAQQAQQGKQGCSVGRARQLVLHARCGDAKSALRARCWPAPARLKRTSANATWVCFLDAANDPDQHERGQAA
jgi:hypothetical protein